MSMRRALAGLTILAATAGNAGAETPTKRGDYLVNVVMTCGSCHTPRGPEGRDRPFAGGPEFEERDFTVHGSNITPDPETGIGRWSDADIKRAVTVGVRPDGTRLAPTMPSGLYKALSARDLDAVVAYLRSLAPISNAIPRSDYRAEVPAEVVPGGERPIEEAARQDQVTQGFYLATIGRCIGCHTSRIADAADFDKGLGKGGLEFNGPWGVSVAANITSSRTKGLGAWSDAEIKRAISQGTSRDGRKLKPPMAYAAYARMTEADLDAIVAWLRTVPALE